MKSILLKNSRIMDAFTGFVTDSDIFVENGIVSKVAQDIKVGRDVEIIDVENAYISTGWVEAHTHITWFGNEGGLIPELTYPADGITYVNDAGTEGPLNYSYVHEMMQSLSIRSSSYLYVAMDGTSPAGGELKSLDYLNEEKFKEVYEAYKDEIIGVKIRIDARVNYDILESLKRAKRLARELSLPLIVHPTRCTEPLEKVLKYLDRGDVYAHTYSALAPCILDDNGIVKDCVREARKRGVWFDLSHGSSNFSFDIARKSIEQDFVVDTISTDLHTANIHSPVRSIADTMSKMLYLGLPIEMIINKVTVAPVNMLGLQDKSLSIKEGDIADITVFRIEDGDFTFSDSYGNIVHSKQRVSNVVTIYGENVYLPRKAIFLK